MHYYEMHTFYGAVPDITMVQKISCREDDDLNKVHNLTEEEAKWIFNHLVEANNKSDQERSEKIGTCITRQLVRFEEDGNATVIAQVII